MPTAWNDTYGAVMGSSGQTIVQDRNGDRSDRWTDWRMGDGDKRTAQGAERVELSRAAGARAASKSSLPKAPPSTRKAAKLPNGFILN